MASGEGTMTLVEGEEEDKAGVGGTRVPSSQGGDQERKAWPGCLRLLLGERPTPP